MTATPRPHLPYPRPRAREDLPPRALALIKSRVVPATDASQTDPAVTDDATQDTTPLPIETDFLLDGDQTPDSVAERLIVFVAAAGHTIDVAIYDFHARVGATARIADALEAAAAKGVEVRVAFNVENPTRASQPRPAACAPEDIDGLDVPSRGVHDEGALMHHKYVVRDGEAVWTGSTNWTDDAFSREENAILRIASPEIAAAYTANFEQLWARGRIEPTGGEGTFAKLSRGVMAQPFFSPKGPSLAHRIAERIATARRRLRVLTPVLTSGALLGTLAEFAGRSKFDLHGAYDATQMREVEDQWRAWPPNHWKIEAWHAIRPRLSGKVSTPYSPDAVHDYMHAKVVVVDDEVLTGSYNLSRGGEDNAENLVHIVSEPEAIRFAEFADRVAERYATGAATEPSPSG